MLHQEIKSKQKCDRVAKELAEDLRKELECFGNYDVDVEKTSYEANVKVTSDRPSSILTDSAIGYALKVVNVYKFMYNYISWHICTEEREDRHIPAFIISVSYKKD